jgi:hypothetical protein
MQTLIDRSIVKVELLEGNFICSRGNVERLGGSSDRSGGKIER